MNQAVSLAKELIKIPSTAEKPQALTRVLQVAQLRLKGFGVRKFISDKTPSLLFYPGKTQPKKFKLLLNAHLDVVPGKPGQFNPSVKNGRLYGRGAQDMKGGAASLILVFKTLAKTLNYPVGLQLVTDEEIGGTNGAKHQLKNGLTAEFVIAGEPTEFRINNQSKGIVRVDLVAHGKTAHGAYPWRGKNAVSLVTKTVDNILKKYPVPQKEAWRTTANLSWIKTDNQTTNKVPAQAEARLDIRYLPQEIKTIKASLKDLVALPVKLKFVAFEPAQFTKSTNPFIKKLIQATHKITGKKPKIYSTHGGSDIRLFNARGIGGITFGPIGGGLHSDQEWVDIKSLNTYQKILTRFLISYT